MVEKNILEILYHKQNYSVAKIATILKCSQTKVNYWLKKYNIKKRSISDALYLKNNPTGDPFCVNVYHIDDMSMLYGLGMGLYWGEGTKASKNSIRLGNTDPYLILSFIKFLAVFFDVKKTKLKFGLQVFSDLDTKIIKKYWMNVLGISSHQFYKIIVSKTTNKGTYKKKTKYGVLTVYFNNTKLRNILNEKLEKIKNIM